MIRIQLSRIICKISYLSINHHGIKQCFFNKALTLLTKTCIFIFVFVTFGTIIAYSP
jgi:hypothetical protein